MSWISGFFVTVKKWTGSEWIFFSAAKSVQPSKIWWLKKRKMYITNVLVQFTEKLFWFITVFNTSEMFPLIVHHLQSTSHVKITHQVASGKYFNNVKEDFFFNLRSWRTSTFLIGRRQRRWFVLILFIFLAENMYVLRIYCVLKKINFRLFRQHCVNYLLHTIDNWRNAVWTSRSVFYFFQDTIYSQNIHVLIWKY